MCLSKAIRKALPHGAVRGAERHVQDEVTTEFQGLPNRRWTLAIFNTA